MLTRQGRTSTQLSEEADLLSLMGYVVMRNHGSPYNYSWSKITILAIRLVPQSCLDGSH